MTEDKLTFVEKLNIYCDKLAKLYWDLSNTIETPTVDLPHQGIVLTLQVLPIIKNVDNELYSYCCKPMIMKKWDDTRNIDASKPDKIDWTAIQKAMVRHLSDREATCIEMKKMTTKK